MINHRAVLFFERNEEGTFNLTSSTGDVSHRDAFDIYCNTLNPASQLVEAETLEELDRNIKLRIEQMKEKDWLDKNLEPYL